MMICGLLSLVLAIQSPSGDRPSLSVHNPTRCGAPSVVEIPTGRVAAPGAVDWTRVRLVCDARDVPFTIRTNHPWRSAEGAADDASAPRADDLLVFVCDVPPGATKRLEIADTGSDASSPVSVTDGRLSVEFPTVKAVFEQATGRLIELAFAQSPALEHPLDVAFHRLESPGHALQGSLGPGYHTFQVELARTEEIAHEARFIGHAYSGALVEIRWMLQPIEGPCVPLTYRVYANGTLEVETDDGPWEAPSPWMSHAVEWTLSLRGQACSIPTLETRFAYYGFKDFTAAFPTVARVWRDGDRGVLETGEQAVNGRRFYRRLIPFANADDRTIDDLIELADEGLVVVTTPPSVPWADRVVVSAPPAATAVIAKLTDTLRLHREVVVAEPGYDRVDLQLTLSHDPTPWGIVGDGFTIQRRESGRVEVVAGTVLGLRQAVQAIDDHLTLHGPAAGVPLVAANPIVPLRGGGFGGGTFEVDFPYGSVAEWERVLDRLMDSGMNVLTCLGMWGNWKMPVSYRYLPALRSDDPEAYDESSGTLLREVDAHREHGLHLLQHVQQQGGRVWLWLPIGCVPTTFARAFPEAMMPGEIEEFWGRAKGTPCFTHARYHEYLDALLRELIETYPVDGLMLVRDDNGKLCSCERCRAFVESSRTRQAAWEQYLIIYDRLRELGFSGAVAVYPYFDGYTPDLERVLPSDLYIVGHGASIAGLTRHHDRVGHMPDTWLDNLFTNFRVPPTPRVRRLLRDRSTFWIGGAYCGTELPWEAIGHFGWEPTSTPNTFRYLWGARTFGVEHAAWFRTVSDLYEDLWEVHARYMLPKVWLETPPDRRAMVLAHSLDVLEQYGTALETLRARVRRPDMENWFGHMELFDPYLRYHLHRLECLAANHTLVVAHKQAVLDGVGLPADVRRTVVEDHRSVYQYARRYDEALHAVPGAMLEATRPMTMPYREWMAGYEGWPGGPHLELPQFAGEVLVKCPGIEPGQPFRLQVSLRNRGLCPWIAEARHRVTFGGIAPMLGLPESVEYEGEPIAPGEDGMMYVEGVAPAEPVDGTLTVTLMSPYRVPSAIAHASVEAKMRQ